MIVIIVIDYSVAPALHTLEFGGEFSRQTPSQSPMHDGA